MRSALVSLVGWNAPARINPYLSNSSVTLGYRSPSSVPESGQRHIPQLIHLPTGRVR
jgi:hypothetical protein